MNIYETDIYSQPKDLRDALKLYIEESYDKKIKGLCRKKYSRIIFTGMGSSYSACLNANVILRNKGFQSTAVPTSQLLHYEIPSIDDYTLLVIVSQSGRSGEIVDLVNKINHNCTVAALTNDENSPLGMRADLLLNLHVEPEVSVSTRTYLAPLLLLHIFAKVLTGKYDEEVIHDLQRSIDYLESSIKNFSLFSKEMRDFLGMPSCITLIGRGFSSCTVDAGSLFIKEVAKFPSIPYDSGQFRHGPYEMVGPQFSCIIFAPLGNCFDLQTGLAKDIADKGSKVVLITDDLNYESSANILVIHQQYVSQELSGLTNILPVQCFGNYIAKDKNLTVGKFLYGSKITTVQ